MPQPVHIDHKGYSWYHYYHPLTKDDHNFLYKKFEFSHEDLDSCRHKKTPRPEVAVKAKYAFFIFHIPYLKSSSRDFGICELNVFLTKKTMITVESNGNLPALNKYFSKTKSDSKLSESRLKNGPASLFSKVLLEILVHLEELIDKQGEEVERLHREVFEKRFAKQFIETVSILRYNQVVAFSTLERQTRVLDQFHGDNNPLLSISKNGSSNWRKIITTFQAASYELERDMEHVEGLVKTFESLVTYRTNSIIKLLTVFSVILLPLTLISGIYGMNFTHLPLAVLPFGFWIVIILMAIIALIMALVFKKKLWI